MLLLVDFFFYPFHILKDHALLLILLLLILRLIRGVLVRILLNLPDHRRERLLDIHPRLSRRLYVLHIEPRREGLDLLGLNDPLVLHIDLVGDEGHRIRSLVLNAEDLLVVVLEGVEGLAGDDAEHDEEPVALTEVMVSHGTLCNKIHLINYDVIKYIWLFMT